MCINMCYIIFGKKPVIEKQKHGNIKNKPNQTKPVKITKTKNSKFCLVGFIFDIHRFVLPVLHTE